MHKKLEDLTKQEWDMLFPIELQAHDPDWKRIFEREKQQIQEKLGDQMIAIEHVGSTAIPDILAKAYIDISIEILEENLFKEEIIKALEALNYHFFRQAGKGVDYMIFVKGYALNGEKQQIFHIHMCPTGHQMLNQISFRDYLLDHPQRARAYEELKIALAVQYKNNRVGYRMAKDQFIEETMKLYESKE